jgi:CRP/FNR family cyclic AMP-dependent transcriptional regulator
VGAFPRRLATIPCRCDQKIIHGDLSLKAKVCDLHPTAGVTFRSRSTIMPSPADTLADVPLFALLDEHERSILAEQVDLVTMRAGEQVFAYGEPGDSMYVVCAGAVELFFKNDTGDRIVLETARAGDFFGEISLLDGGPRTASALVLEDITALRVDRDDLDVLLSLKPHAATDLLTATGKRLRESSRLLRHTASRNVNKEHEDHRTAVMRVADWISDFSGSLPFLFIHLGLFFIWIVLNVGPLVHGKIGGFDPFPFGLLTMAVSLEAIVLSVFVLLSQNRQVERERVRNDIEFDINLKAELQIHQMHEKVDQLQEALLERLTRMERKLGVDSIAPKR